MRCTMDFANAQPTVRARLCVVAVTRAGRRNGNRVDALVPERGEGRRHACEISGNTARLHHGVARGCCARGSALEYAAHVSEHVLVAFAPRTRGSEHASQHETSSGAHGVANARRLAAGMESGRRDEPSCCKSCTTLPRAVAQLPKMNCAPSTTTSS